MKNISSFSRTAGLLTGALLVFTTSRAAEADAFPTFDGNYVKLSASGADVSGSKAAYQAHTQNAKSGAAGIEALNYSYELGKDTSLEIDGKALPGPEDYLLSFKLTKNEVGNVDVGFKRSRTFYDGSGGFFPMNNTWLPLYPQQLFVDRGKFFANATVAIPNAPVFTFGYTADTRSGRKGSTIWGDTNLTGIPSWTTSSLNPYSAARKILPAYTDVDERLEKWEAMMKHTVGNTSFAVSWAAHRMRNVDVRSYDRNTGELKPYPYPYTGTVLVANRDLGSPTYGNDRQAVKEQGQTIAGTFETVMNDKVTLFGGLNYLKADEALGIDRIIKGDIATVTGVQTQLGAMAPGGRPPYTYQSVGKMEMDVLTGNLGVRTKPLSTLNVEVALRGERYKDSGFNDKHYWATLITPATGAILRTEADGRSSLDNNEKPWTPTVDVRYTGIRNLALYGSWEYRTAKQTERNVDGGINVNTSAGTISPSVASYNDSIKENHSNFTVGGNWTPVQVFSLRAEFFSKDHENRFASLDDPSVSVLDYDIYGVKLTTVVKPLKNVSLTTRYIGQRGKAVSEMTGQITTKADDSRRHQISETVDWNPSRSVYAQANANLVFDTIKSAYPYVSGLAKDVIRNSDNNYWNGDVTVGFVLTKNTDAQLLGTYYRADNYEPAPLATLPLGAGAREYTVGVGLKHKFGPKTVANAKIGYMDSKNDTTGGFTNFHGPMAYVSLERAF